MKGNLKACWSLCVPTSRRNFKCRLNFLCLLEPARSLQRPYQSQGSSHFFFSNELHQRSNEIRKIYLKRWTELYFIHCARWGDCNDYFNTLIKTICSICRAFQHSFGTEMTSGYTGSLPCAKPAVWKNRNVCIMLGRTSRFGQCLEAVHQYYDCRGKQMGQALAVRHQ